MLGLTPIFIVVTVVLLSLYLYKFSKERPENFPPGPPKLPIWGSYWFLLKENYNLLYLSLEKLGKRYKTDILGFHLGPFPTVAVLSHELLKEMLKREEFLGRIGSVVVIARSRGNPKGIFFTDGGFWQEHKRFSLRHMRDHGFGRRADVMEDFMVDEIRYVIDFLSNKPTKEDLDICKEKGVVLLPDFLNVSLTNAAMLPLTSTRVDNQKAKELAKASLRFMQSIDGIGGAITQTPWLRYLAPDFFGYTSAVRDNAILTGFMHELIDEHMKTFSDDHHRDFIDDYISENMKRKTEIDYNQFLLVLVDYLFPNTTALSQSLGFIVACLINNPQAQAKAQEEIDRVIGTSRIPNLDDRKNLPYVEACIREGLRLVPVTPLIIPRRCLKDTMLGGYFIPQNTVLIPNLWTAQRDERVYKNPMKFMPERFLDADGNIIKRDESLSFGIGKRLCPGETHSRQTMFLIMASILQNYTLKSCTGKPIDVDHLIYGITLSLKETWIEAVPR